MAFISENEINQIRDSANIVDIIGSYVSLEKKGNDYVGICPFHEDHSPSMHVSTKLNIYKCFVCNAGGNVFTFVKNFLNVPYLEAVKIVADKSGINFAYTPVKDNNSKFKKEFDMMDLSLRFYQNNLASSEGKEAKQYLSNRGIDEQIIKDFKIGLSFNDNKLKEFLENKNCSLEKAYDLGLLNKSGIDYYDMFNDRIMIPLFDMQNNPVGYTARAYKKDEQNKYINTKETLIYHKSNILFNYYNAKDVARLNKEIIVVEGNMDAISLYARGIKNVIALMGVVVSKVQIEALKRLNSKVILMLDSDNAGSGATLKVGDQMMQSGLDVYTVRLSGAKDPDEYIRAFGTNALLDNIKHPTKYLDYKLQALKENKNLDNPQELTEYIKAILDSLKNADELEKEVTIAKICKEYGLDPNIIKKNLAFTPKEITKPPKAMQEKKSRYDLACSQVIYAMLLHKEYYQIFMNKLGYLQNKVERETVSLIGSYIKQNNNIDIAGFIDFIIKYDNISEYVNKVISSLKVGDMSENDFIRLLNVMTICINENEIKEIKMQIKNENDMNKKLELLEQLAELKKDVGKDEGN